LISFVVLLEIYRQEFQGNRAIKLEVLGLKHFSHAARAYALKYAVMRDHFAHLTALPA